MPEWRWTFARHPAVELHSAPPHGWRPAFGYGHAHADAPEVASRRNVPVCAGFGCPGAAAPRGVVGSARVSAMAISCRCRAGHLCPLWGSSGNWVQAWEILHESVCGEHCRQAGIGQTSLAHYLSGERACIGSIDLNAGSIPESRSPRPWPRHPARAAPDKCAQPPGAFPGGYTHRRLRGRSFVPARCTE